MANEYDEASPKEKARLVAEAWENNNARNMDGEYVCAIGSYEVRLSEIVYGDDGDNAWVDVWVGAYVGAPTFRICNPPILVKDPRGDVEVSDIDPRGREVKVKFRNDPVRAIAEMVADVRGSR